MMLYRNYINFIKCRWFCAALAVLLQVATLASCKNFSSVRDPYTLFVHIGAEPGNLNPVTMVEAIASRINEHIYETLLDRDYDTLELVPCLAESWEVSPDRMRYRFRLKKGVRWSDGREFTSDDIIYSFRRMKDPKVANAPIKVYYVDVRDVRAIDRYTVDFYYSKRYFRGLEICGMMPLVPRHIFDNGTDFNTHKNNRFPVGTGPFKFDMWDTGKKLVLVRNEKYRGKKPAIRRIVYKVVPEANIALQMLKKGELDVVAVRTIQWVRQTNSSKFKKNFYKLKYYMPQYSYIGWNAEKEIFRDKRVRLAMTHLVNRKEILDKLLFGLGKIVTGTFYINSKFYNKDIKPWPYDLKKGRELLKAAGWTDSDGDGFLDKNGKKFTFVFTIPSASKIAERLSTILKEDFARVGIDMNINRYEWAVFVQKLHQRDFDAVTLAWSLDWEADPYQLWHSSQIKGGSNFCGFSNREADRIIMKTRREFDESRRVELLHRFHEILHENQPYTFMFCTPALVVVNRRFENVKVHTRGLNILEWDIRKTDE